MIPILFEDNEVIALNKPEGLATIREREPGAGSLMETLSDEGRRPLHVVHRIDKPTSGLVLFTKTADAHRWLCRKFEERSVAKTYLALCHGTVADDEGKIDAPLRTFGSGRVGVDAERGKPSVTLFDVLDRREGFTLVAAYPRSGRRHQIRVHLYHLGHPIAGDPLYGDTTLPQGFGRMMLHAWKLAVRRPSGRMLRLEAPIPESFTRVLETIDATRQSAE